MSETNRRARMLREELAPYATADATTAFVKLSISLPADLATLVRTTATESGSTVSAMVAAALRRTVEDVEQRRLDAALAADAEENVAWAEASAAVNAKLLAELEW